MQDRKEDLSPRTAKKLFEGLRSHTVSLLEKHRTSNPAQFRLTAGFSPRVNLGDALLARFRLSKGFPDRTASPIGTTVPVLYVPVFDRHSWANP